MINTQTITRDTVIERSKELPGFPLAISQILTTLDDYEANLNVLAHHVKHDPVISARVLSLANIAATRTRQVSGISNIYTAISLIGIGKVREMTLVSSIADFSDIMAPALTPSFWQHSVAAGVCGEELARYTSAPVSPDAALIAGLLHDIGQLWLYRFDSETFHTCRSQALIQSIGIEQIEREHFGVDHAIIGGWLAEHWSLPANICAAIRYHHAPDSALNDTLIPLVHVAEVLSNALNLASGEHNLVNSISSAACEKIGLTFDADILPLFGRIEARSRHANVMFK